MEHLVRFILFLLTLLCIVILSAFLFALDARGQTLATQVTRDPSRARSAAQPLDDKGRKGGYRPSAIERLTRQRIANDRKPAHADSAELSLMATSPIAPGTLLSRILQTSQFDLHSSAGTSEQFVDRNGDLTADERTTFDFAGGSFDMAVGQSGARYQVFSGTRNHTLAGFLVVAVDTNGDYVMDSSATYDLERDFSLPSAASVVTGNATSGREFVIVSSSGYYNSDNPSDPNNEPSPGVVLLIRETNGPGFDNTLSRSLVRVGDNRLYNANGLALLPNNDLLIADFHSDELRIIRDTNADGLPDTLDPVPYYSYRFSDDSPLDVAVNSRGVVFSHSVGNDSLMLAIYDDDGDGRGDRDEVVVEGLSIDNNLFVHGLTVDRLGNVYVIEDAMGSSDGSGGNGGTPQLDAFPDGQMNGFLQNGKIFMRADSASLAVSGLSFAPVTNQINNARFFVGQHYLDFLGRVGDPGGLDYWSDQIMGCNNGRCINSRRIGVSAAFFIEMEFQDTGSFVYRLYKGSLGRRPSFNEFSTDRSTIVAGSNLEANKQALVNDWVGRTGFLQLYPPAQTPEQFVNKLFDTAGLFPFTAERERLANEMRNGKTRAQAVREVIDLTAFRTREYNPSFVLMQYFGYLRREPDQGGYDFWLNVLNNREPNNYRGMVCSFITSREYQERFGLLLRRTNTDCAE
jgi:Domain of unknown function (DUF4214)